MSHISNLWEKANKCKKHGIGYSGFKRCPLCFPREFKKLTIEGWKK
jgi:hypothetical protein